MPLCVGGQQAKRICRCGEAFCFFAPLRRAFARHTPAAVMHRLPCSTTRGMGYALAASALAGAAAAAADSACAGAAVVRWLVPAPAFLVRITRTPCLPSRLYAATYEKIVHPRGCILKSLLLRLVVLVFFSSISVSLFASVDLCTFRPARPASCQANPGLPNRSRGGSPRILRGASLFSAARSRRLLCVNDPHAPAFTGQAATPSVPGAQAPGALRFVPGSWMCLSSGRVVDAVVANAVARHAVFRPPIRHRRRLGVDACVRLVFTV